MKKKTLIIFLLIPLFLLLFSGCKNSKFLIVSNVNDCDGIHDHHPGYFLEYQVNKKIARNSSESFNLKTTVYHKPNLDCIFEEGDALLIYISALYMYAQEKRKVLLEKRYENFIDDIYLEKSEDEVTFYTPDEIEISFYMCRGEEKFRLFGGYLWIKKNKKYYYIEDIL